jgi:hypothetical protein
LIKAFEMSTNFIQSLILNTSEQNFRNKVFIKDFNENDINKVGNN